MKINLQRVREAGLDLGRRKRILDLGCGTGYFLCICQFFGHEILGLDMDNTPRFAEMIALLAVPRLIWEIAPFVRLPDLGEKYDVITAHMICFNGHKSANLWGIREWEFFLDDLARHLEPRGLIWLELNREYDGTHYTPELKAYFESRGAEVHTQRVRFHPLRLAPGVGARVIAGFRDYFARTEQPAS
jgi:SAM-dependent methyltransferase